VRERKIRVQLRRFSEHLKRSFQVSRVERLRNEFVKQRAAFQITFVSFGILCGRLNQSLLLV
jgi:hypothetical protein